jgi:DNA-directed RNA polymerase subunit M/transcription elongation factor TFIIS
MIMDIFRKVIEDQKVYCGKCSAEMETTEVTEDVSGNLRENLKCKKCGATSVYFVIGKDQEDDLAAFSGR